MKLLLRRRGSQLGLLGIGLLTFFALGADLLGTVAAARERVAASAPSPLHLLGTDIYGRDVLVLLVHGTRASLAVGLGSVVIVLALGVSLGALAGYFGGRFDGFLTRSVEVLLSFPTILVALAIRGITGRSEVVVLAVIIGLLRWTDVARVTRAEVLKAMSSDYVVAAQALGLSPLRVLIRHILPDAVQPAIVAAPFAIAAAVVVESSLSFLGVGVGTTSWGELLAQARTFHPGWWLSVFPGLAIFITVASFHVLGETLRDVTDPRLRGAL